jgi:O-antigen/teichoic acid export membrane protein
MTQSRLGSFLEALVNTLIGLVVSLVSTIILMPLVGIHSTMAQNVQLTVYFTAVSIARSYLLRRYFNKRLHRALENV